MFDGDTVWPGASPMSNRESRATCETVLARHRQNNIDANILSSHNRIIDRMLNRGLELKDAYDEIYVQLDGVDVDRDLYVFFDGLLCVAATWNPAQVAKSREGRRQLEQVNRQIAKVAQQLAGLLEERDTLNNQSGFASDTHYDICQVIEDASADNSRFSGWVKQPLALLNSQFDLKYWPTLSECIRVIGTDAEGPRIAATNSTTEAATSSARGGDSDFFRAFDRRLSEEGRMFPKLHPSRFKLSNSALATLMSCALGRTDDDMFDADYVKRLRQRDSQKPPVR
jgi:hypothetical protein